jgi:phage-related baseplate assembly protein
MSDFSTVQNLSDIDFISTSVTDLLSVAIKAYQDKYYELTGTTVTVQPGDDVYILLYAEALRQYSVLQSINVAAKMNFLKYATGVYLDQLAANTGNIRSAASASVCTLRFALSSAQTSVITIPVGTRATAGDGVYFATDAAAYIAIGSTTIDVTATCTTTGLKGEGYIAGQLNILVDSIAYVVSVTNTDITSGGSEIESDLSLAQKVFASPSGYSVAGPAAAYDYFTRAYSSAVIDNSVVVPSGGVVDVYVLLTGGTLPGDTLLAKIKSYLEPYRPATDNLSVLAPTAVNYNVAFTYYIDSQNSDSADSIQTAVVAAAAEFTTWTKSKIGRDIIPDQMTAKIIAAGAKRVVLTSPAAYTAVSNTSVAIAVTVTPTYGGLE